MDNAASFVFVTIQISSSSSSSLSSHDTMCGCMTLDMLATANFVGMLSCDLLEYTPPSSGGGTIGLFGFRLDNHNGSSSSSCVPFSEYAEDDGTFRPARIGTLMALTLAIVLLCLNLVHYSFCTILHKEVLFCTIGALQQLSLALIRVLSWNSLCETYGCTLGEGNSWIGLAHVMYLASMCINVFIGEPNHVKERRQQQQQQQRLQGTLKQHPFSITSPLTRQGSSRSL